MARLDTWRDWTALADLAHIAVAQRNGQPPGLNPALAAWHTAHHAPIDAIHRAPAGAVVDLPMTPVDASATEIRALLAAPPSQARDLRLSRLVPAAVLLYIRREGLYRTGP